MTENYRETLQKEFMAEQGSFLLQLRINLFWDKVAFERLTEAMRACCKEYEREQRTDEQYQQAIETLLPRWLVSGFWYLTTFVPEHTSHPVWEKVIKQEPDYFQKAYERLEALTSWFFEGQAPWADEGLGWASTVVAR